MLLGTVAAGFVWSPPFERVAARWIPGLQDQLTDTQLTLSLGILLLSVWVALFLMVRAYHAAERQHADELAATPAAAAAQSTAALVTKRSRRALLLDE